MAQFHRDDEIGSIARAWVESTVDKSLQISFEEWWRRRKNGLIMTSATGKAESEYNATLATLGAGKSHQTFPLHWATESYRNRSERRSKIHEANPELTAPEYLHLLHRLLKREIDSRKIVYLDTFYWIKMRDALINQSTAEYKSLFDELKALVEKGTIICPISYSLFEELMRQKDPETRDLTAYLMDTLSAGVCLQNPESIIEIEIRRQIYRSIRPEMKEAWTEWIWTKVGFLFGDHLPVNSGFTVDQNNLIQKVFIDEMWSELSLVELIGQLDESEFGLPDNEITATATNKDFRYVRESRMAEKDIRHQELSLVWHKHYAETFVRVLKEIWNEEQEACAAYMTRNEEPPKPASDVLPNLQILATLSTFFATDQRKIVTPTDITDLEHAAFALPYADVYTCDRGLAHAIKQGPHHFHDTHRTIVCGGIRELSEVIENLKK